MEAKPTRPQHPSYQLHRRQVAWQIVLPVLLAGVLVIGMAVLVSLATFGGTGDVSRWAAISTIWLVIPVLFVGLLILVALVAVSYLLGRVEGFIPPYSVQAQRFAVRVQAGARRVAEVSHRPTLLVPEIGRLIKIISKAATRRISEAMRRDGRG
jgi:hypothetical protein